MTALAIKARSKFSIALLFTALATLALVSGETPWSEAWGGLFIDRWNPLLHERIPRFLVLLCSGASLAVAGSVMQALFHNPLAAPNILGISAGGSLMAIGAFALGWSSLYPFAIPAASVIGCILSLFTVYFLATRKGEAATLNLILTGIAYSTVLIALQSALLYALRDNWQLIQTISEWEAGTTMHRSWQHVHMQAPLTIVGLIGAWSYRKELNLLSLGDEEALSLGVEVQQVRWRLMLCVALLTGGTLAAIGVVAFFGLVLPHIVRRCVGANNAILIPWVAVLGALVLTSLDLLLRLLNIHILTIGNVSAVLGGLFFLILLVDKGAVK